MQPEFKKFLKNIVNEIVHNIFEETVFPIIKMKLDELKNQRGT